MLNELNIFKRHTSWGMIAALCVSALTFQAEAAFISNGQSDYQIVLCQDAIPAEVTAAQELQSYLQKITDVKLPIVSEKTDKPAIFVGQSKETAQVFGGLDFSALRPDEILLKTSGDDLFLSGDRPRGTLYAVYELLEKEFGVRFWSYDATDVPQTKTLELPKLDIRYAPTLFYREAYYDMFMINPAFNAQRHINGHDTTVPPEWGDHLTIHGSSHTFDQYLPSKTYFKDHPEWYNLRDGKRQQGYGQLCLTNEEMRKALLDVVLTHLRKEPNTRIIDVSQNDNDAFCRCEKCEAFVKEHGNQSDLLIDLVNYVADAIKDEFPDTVVETLAYQYTRSAPKSIFPHDNVMIRLCSIECSFNYPLDSEVNKSFSDDVRDWSKIAPTLFIWNYVTDFSKYYLPQPNWENLPGDIRFLLDHKVRGLFEQGSCGSFKIADLPELRAYLLSRLMWDPSQDENEIIAEFLNGFYGPAALEILQYIDLMKKAVASHPEHRLRCFPVTTRGWLSDNNLAAAWRIMNRAKAKTVNNPKYQKRVEFAALPITFALLERPEMFRYPEFKDMDLEELIKKSLASSKDAETRIFSEVGKDYETFEIELKRPYPQLSTPEGPKPAVAGNRQWFDISPKKDSLSYLGQFAFLDDDPAGLNGKAARMPDTHYEWAFQLHNLPIGDFEIFAEIRCDNKVDKDVFTAGVYNEEKRETKSVAGKGTEIAGNEYTIFKIAEYNIDSNTFVWVAPVKGSGAGNIWINRIIFVEKE